MRYMIAFLALLFAFPAQAQIVIAHRGASGERPEHTLAAYERAIDEGADFIEPDLVPTKDGVLVARHENEIGATTDVAAHREFARRRKTVTVDGGSITGWFTEDFTLAELRTLRAREIMPLVRPGNARFDGLYSIPTFAEIVALVKAKEAESGRRIGIYPELKHPAYFARLGIDNTPALMNALTAAGYTHAADPVFVQCFEVAPLVALRPHTHLRLIQLIAAHGGPPDQPGMTFAAMMTPAGLAEVARYADGIGVEATALIGADGKATSVIADAHAAGLQVHAWTLRRENRFLPAPLRIGTDPGAPGNFAAAWALLHAAGVDGVFTDNPGSVPGVRPGAVIHSH